MKIYPIKYLNYFFALSFALMSFSKAQETDLEKVNLNIPSLSISKQKIESGAVATTYKIIPRSIDSYAEQKIAGIIILTDADDNFLRLDPILHKIDLPDVSTILEAIENRKSFKEILESGRFNELTEIQKLCYLRKFATATLICEKNDLTFSMEEKEMQLLDQSLKVFDLKVEKNYSLVEMQALARLILRKVSFNDQ